VRSTARIGGDAVVLDPLSAPIAAFIKDVSHHDAGPESVQLAAAGWPLHGIDESAVSQ
jgi:hypothetical protein